LEKGKSANPAGKKTLAVVVVKRMKRFAAHVCHLVISKQK